MDPYLQHAHAARVVFAVGVAAFAAGEFAQALRWRRGASRVDVIGELVFRLVFFAGILMLAVGPALVPRAVIGGGVGVFIVGAVIAGLGLLLRWWSFITLGTYFTTVVKTSTDQRVIDQGPYRVLRHPSYTGLLVAFVGCGLMLGSWVGAAGSFGLILAALVYRLRREERALVAALGNAYVTFAEGRARLVPFIW